MTHFLLVFRCRDVLETEKSLKQCHTCIIRDIVRVLDLIIYKLNYKWALLGSPEKSVKIIEECGHLANQLQIIEI